MTPAQAMVAATKNGAIASQALKDYGTLEAGKLADIVVLNGDPLADAQNLLEVHMVIKGGEVVVERK